MNKRIIFELSMPNNNSWNGKWSGEDRKYTVSKTLSKKDCELFIGKSYHYNFSDGWSACVVCRLPAPREKATNNFNGYSWMIESILLHNQIKKLNNGE